MATRREFMQLSAGAMVISCITPAWANGQTNLARKATAITKVFGEGARFIGIAVEYDDNVKASELSTNLYQVSGRTVTGAFVSKSINPDDKSDIGRFVIVNLSADDATAPLLNDEKPQKPQTGEGKGKNGVGKAGEKPFSAESFHEPQATIMQKKPILAENGKAQTIADTGLQTSAVENLIVDDFKQLSFVDPTTGKTLQYNLFKPKDYDETKTYPLVLFMHDAGATGNVARTTLLQGLGAICWASPTDQAKRPCFVLAPQFDEIITDDDSKTSDLLDTTISLIKKLCGDYHIDTNRIYTTGQSGGCMASIALNIKYPDFFAASFLVAGQWDPTVVQPLAKAKLWVVVSEDDDKAYPGQDAIMEVLAKQGAAITRAQWDARWSAEEFQAAFDKIDAKKTPINYVTFEKGTVIPQGQTAERGGGHRNTWRVAYTIEPIREWIFRQHK